MGNPNQGARFSKDKVHAIFKDYLYELREEKKKYEIDTVANYALDRQTVSVEELYRRLGLGKI